MQPTPAWRWLGVTAAACGLAAVVLAALGAHAVPLRDAAAMRLWDTALEIHLFHVVAMLGMAAIAMHRSGVNLMYGGMGMAVGILLFSGSLYLRAAGIFFLPAWLAPTGGLLLIAAWLWLFMILIKKTPN